MQVYQLRQEKTECNNKSRCKPCFFFFQAEDGIRDVAVTGVQTCALPICAALCSDGASSARAAGGLVEAAVRAFVEIAALGKTYATPAGPAEIVRDFSLYVEDRKSVV